MKKTNVYVFIVYFDGGDALTTCEQAVISTDWTEATKKLMSKHEYYMEGFRRKEEITLL
jgi:hypothetical protein